ncbi:phosphoribosylglycinamide formyltransferase [Bacillus songklensis]|uniref:Phosphoribosylglycinamide formyltransferase n=1 Tax=Bacillus songklensis TaxID=1069116 RepID=A0ABV8B561_9BACI
MISIAVFASGSGSNFQAIYDATQSGRLQAQVSLLVCDKPDAKVIERAEKAGVQTFVFSPKDFASKEEYETEIYKQLSQQNVEFIVLAGYMRLIGSVLLEKFKGKIVNIHPSLLPSFPGKDAIGQAVKAGVKVTGVTIHYVDAGMDTGPIIAQQAIEIGKGYTRETIEQRIHQVEHAIYAETLQQLFQQIKKAGNSLIKTF